MVEKPLPLYRRVLLKLSGEILAGEGIFCPKILNRVCQEIKLVADMGVEVCLVIGGGNIFRGNIGEMHGMDRSRSDHIGMLATVMNALAVQNCMNNIEGMEPRVMTAIQMNEIAEPYTRRRAFHHIDLGRVVILAAGIGNPFFTTDTAAAQRACELNCDVILKGTKVDGIYCSDPAHNKDANFHPTLSYQDVLTRDLNVMDAAAISLAKENSIPVVVFNIQPPGQLAKVVQGQGIFTKVS